MTQKKNVSFCIAIDLVPNEKLLPKRIFSVSVTDGQGELSRMNSFRALVGASMNERL